MDFIINVISSRVVNGSVQVGFVPILKPTRRNRVGKKGIHRQPVGVIWLGSSDHQRVVGGSIGFKTARKWWKKHRSNENLTGFIEISPNPVKISLDLREQCRNLGFFVGFWKILAGIWKSFSQFGFFGFYGRKIET